MSAVPGGRSPIVFVLAIAASAGSLFGLLVSLFLFGFTCDESCADPPEVWSDDPDAWQWKAQLGLAGIATALAIYAVATRNASNARVALGTSIVSWIVWMLWMGIF